MLEVRFEDFDEKWENGTNSSKRDLYDLDKEEMEKIFDSDYYKKGNPKLNNMARVLTFTLNIIEIPINIVIDYLNELRDWNHHCFSREIRQRHERYDKDNPRN